MPSSELRGRLEALFGPVRTAERFAGFLGVDRRTVFRWLAGDRPVPPQLPLILELLDRMDEEQRAEILEFVGPRDKRPFQS